MCHLQRAISERTARVGVIGLGYVGLPAAMIYADSGFVLLGFDTDPAKVESLRAGSSYIGHVPSARIQNVMSRARFEASGDMSRLGEADVLIICVPTPVTESRDPDLTYVESTARQIAETLRRGQLILLESTTYPGTTRDVVLPILESTGLCVGEDFFLAFGPEREDPGNPSFTGGNIPKIVGGIDDASLELARQFYQQVFVSVRTLSTCEAAEACKLLENTYRAVNIALVNELKILFSRMGIDIWEVIEAAKTKPFGFQAFYPGPGLGGQCIPVDPFYLSWVARKHGTTSRFVELAGETNARMPEYVFQRLTAALNRCGKPVQASKICLLGVAYKKDIDDPRGSPAFALLELLTAAGAEVSYNDPYVHSLPRVRYRDVPDLECASLAPEFLAAQDCVLIVTDHSCYDYDFIVQHAALVVDTRNATRHVRVGRDRICMA